MNRLPKKYFKSITDYVKVYYTAYGVKNYADKLYNALKAVTKDFTRTDPVYVRIGEDGEPEIHYTMTQASAYYYFRDISFTGCVPSLYIHNAKILTRIEGMFAGFRNVNHIEFDSAPNVTSLSTLCYGSNLKSLKIPGTLSGITNLYFAWAVSRIETLDIDLTGSKPTTLINAFYSNYLRVVPAVDCSSAEYFENAFSPSGYVEDFKPYGMKFSFSLFFAALKHDAILEVFNNLGSDVAEGTTLTLGSAKLALMSDEEKKIATDKGWTLA